MIKMTGGKQAGRMDLLTGSLGDKILRFAVPLAATGILQQLFNAADIAVIGRFVGKHAHRSFSQPLPRNLHGDKCRRGQVHRRRK